MLKNLDLLLDFDALMAESDWALLDQLENVEAVGHSDKAPEDKDEAP